MNISKLKESFPELLFEENEVLAPYLYMRVGGKAKALVEVKDSDQLFRLVTYCFSNKVPFIVLGGGSNVIVPDEGLEKLVIINKTNKIEITIHGDIGEVVADSGVVTAVLAAKTIEKELGGLEYFIGVPGTIGGAIVNNSHFTSNDLIGNSVVSVDVCTAEGKKETWDAKRLKFDYDYSIFHERPDIILSATFKLKKSSRAVIDENVRKAALKRVSTQPIGTPSSGCMYRNPIVSMEVVERISGIVDLPEGVAKLREDGRYQIAAGFLIDVAGLKGAKQGDIEVSQKHATYLVNNGKGTTTDVEKLCQVVEKTVFERFGVKLEREVFFLK